MKRFLFLFLLVFTTALVNAQPMSMIQLIFDGNQVYHIKWVYVGGDEFNEDEIDTHKWLDSYTYGRTHVGKELQWYSRGDNFEFEYDDEVESGVLKLVAKEETVYERALNYGSDSDVLSDGLPNLRSFDYTSGAITTKQTYKWGLFEIKLKSTYGQGMWPAFWMYSALTPENDDDCAIPNEIDICELKGHDPDWLQCGIIYEEAPTAAEIVAAEFSCEVLGNCYDPCRENEYEQWQLTGNLPDSYNTFRAEWTPNGIYFTMNSQSVFGAFKNFYHPMHVTANLAIASSGSFGPGPNDQNVFPTSLDIDFIRIWKRLDCDEDKVFCDYTQSELDETNVTGRNISFGGLGCEAVLTEDQYLNVIGTEGVTLGEGFSAVSGSNFYAKTVACPQEGADKEFEKEFGEVRLDRKHDTNNSKDKVLMSIYPNPSDNHVIINMENVDQDKEIIVSLINSFGQSVYTNKLSGSGEHYVGLESFASGIYFLVVQIDGREELREKLIMK